MTTHPMSRSMNILVMGCGRIGSVAVEDLARSLSSADVVVADQNAAKAEQVADGIGEEDVSWMGVDAADSTELLRALRGFDLVMGFLPGELGYRLAQACIQTGKGLVDVSYMSQNSLSLNHRAVEGGVTIVPDCGLAPGISNILVGHAAEGLDEVGTVHIMVGGLPEKPVPPLGYIITWSPENLIDEYTRKARIVEDGELVEVEALTGLELVEFPKVGRLEAFYTDGLRTLPRTIHNVQHMWEKTLRYPGHAQRIRLLRRLGFLDDQPITVDGISLPPKKLTAELLERKLRKPQIRDIVVMKVEVAGIKDDKATRYVYHLLDRYDGHRGVTAMARTTAYPASIVTQLILEGIINREGVIPPERLGRSEQFFSVFLDELEKRGITIREEILLD